MASFDRLVALGHLKKCYGVPALLEADFVRCRRDQCLASHAEAFVDGAIQCFLVSWTDAVDELLRRAEEWSDAAIRDREKPDHYQAFYTEAERYHRLAIARWLRHGVQDEASLVAAVKEWNAYYTQSGAASKEEASLIAVYYLNAGADEDTISLLMRSGLKAPRAAKSATGEAAMAYLLAQHRLRGEYSSTDVTAGLNRMFTANVGVPWLGRGHFERAALWMKVAFWKPGDNVGTTILRCYDFTPDSARGERASAP